MVQLVIKKVGVILVHSQCRAGAILLIAFRNAWAVALGLLSTGVGILVVYATMAVLGMPLNVVLGAMPVILFAVGSAYAIHRVPMQSAPSSSITPSLSRKGTEISPVP